MGIATTGGSAFGAVLAPPLIVAASQAAGWRGAFLITGFIGLVWTIAWLILFRKPEDTTRANAEEVALILEGRDEERSEDKPWPLAALLGRLDVWGFLLTRFSAGSRFLLLHVLDSAVPAPGTRRVA